MLGSFSKLAVLERKKEVATIKSLGANNRDVLCTLWFDSVVISVLAFGLSCVMIGIFSAVFPVVLPEMAFMGFQFPLLLLTLAGLGSLVFIFLYTSLGLRKLIRKMPAELFAQ
jgi:ABC-type antimicrobial peptide transport system permease subunit